MTEEERRQMASRATSTLGRNLAVGGFNNPMQYTPPASRSVFGESAQQSSQDFSRLQMPPSPNIPLGNTIPAFPDNYNQAMTDRSRAPSAMVSGLRDTTSGFGIYGGAAQLGSGQTPPMAPVTNAISSFASPLASRTERIESPYGTASTTLTPEQQVMRSQSRQQAEQAGTMPRTPEQQQALLGQMRERGAAIAQNYTNTMQNFAAERRESPATAYTAQSGGLTGSTNFRVGVPTNRYGQPIPSFQQAYAQRGQQTAPQAPASPTPQPSEPSPFNASVLASTGFGAMQRAQQASIPQAFVQSPLFEGMGYMAAFGGGPQPARSMMMANNKEDGRRRFRRILGLA
jgi:hypothetical protein